MPGANYLLGGINIPQDEINTIRSAAILAILGGIVGPEIINDVTNGKVFGTGLPAQITAATTEAIGTLEQTVGTPMFDLLVTGAAGIPQSAFAGQAAEARGMVERMLGFAMGLPIAISEIDIAARALLGDHAPTELLTSLGKLPEEIGLNYFVGTVLERIFDVAVSQPLEEAIAEIKRPARLQGTELRALLRTKIIDDATGTMLLKRAGYPDDLIPFFLALDRQLLPVGDLQTAYLDGLLTLEDVKSRLGDIGYTAPDADLLTQIYLVRAQTEAGSLYRTIARDAFASNDISEAQFREILTQVHIPPASIDMEIAALTLEKEAGKRHLAVGDVKKAFQEGAMTADQVRSQLSSDGYADDDITQLIALWDEEGKAGKAKVATNRILQYLVSGVLNSADAYSQLVASGMRPQDATFLVDHPGVNGTVYAHGLSEATIISAYKDDIISVDQATALMKQLNIDPAAIDLSIATATKQKQKSGKPKQATKTLDLAQIKEAYDVGIATLPWATRELETIGYSASDADIITATWYAKSEGKVPPGWTILN